MLDLSNTGISDVIPSWFWEATPKLMFLNFSLNQIFGEIPYKRNNFGDNFDMVDLSSNQFTGPLPSDTFSRVLSFLDLSNNFFQDLLTTYCVQARMEQTHMILIFLS